MVSEATQLPAGLSHLYLGRFGLLRVNPPLVRTIAAIPVGLSGATMDWESYDDSPSVRSEFEVARDFLAANHSRALGYFVKARWVCLPFVVLGGYVCFSWARVLYGASAGLLALIVWCSCPYLLGHGSLMTMDVPTAAMGGATAYCFWGWLKRPGWLETIITGVVLGLAELCKFTLLIFYPLLLVLWIVYRLSEQESAAITWREWLRQAAMMAAFVLTSLYTINCGYLFEGTFAPLGTFRFGTMLFSGCDSLDDVPPKGANRFTGAWLDRLPVPLPFNMVQGIDTQRYDFERGMASYLRGRWQKHGWWYYCLYALALKVPLGTWLLLAMAVGATIVGRGYNVPWRDEMVVLVPGLAILFFVSSQTGFSVHSRYVIPALPFLFVWMSKIARVFQMGALTRKRRAVATTVVVALTWSVGSSLWAYPHSLSYFNELIGGPKNGARHLLDSNIDWGQDVLYLKRWLEEHQEVRLNGLAYYGLCPPALARIPEVPQPPEGLTKGERRTVQADHETGPRPGWYALSVNCLHHRSGQHRYFLRFEPAGMAGYSIYIYRVTLEDANRLRHEMGLQELPEDWETR